MTLSFTQYQRGFIQFETGLEKDITLDPPLTQKQEIILGGKVSVDTQLLKVIFEDLKVRLAYKKLGLYLKIRLRFGDFQKIFRNQAFSENRRNSAVFNFFEVWFFPKTFLYTVLLISIIKIRCYVQKKVEFFSTGLFGL